MSKQQQFIYSLLVVSCPTFPTFTIQSQQSVQFGFPLTILCSSTTQSATPPHVSISHSNANESVARGYSGVVEYHIQALSHETAVEYECVASNECGSRSTSIKIECKLLLFSIPYILKLTFLRNL